MRRIVAGALTGLLLGPAAAARADVVLPVPEDTSATQALCVAVQCTADRRRVSKVPGPVVNDETVLVGLAPDGQEVRVDLEQRLLLTGQGDYQIRERGPARSAVTLGDFDPPVTKLGTVVWQGFTPGDRRLAARLTLDPDIERPRLPLGVTLSFRDATGRAVPLGAGGRLPGRGTVTIHLANQTSQPATLPVASDGDPATMGRLLDGLLRAARGSAPARLPAAGAGLPRTVKATAAGRAQASRSVALRVSGALGATGTPAVLTGAGTTPAATGGGTVSGTLSGGQSVDLTLTVGGPGSLALDLRVVPALDPRALAPPDGFATWQQWARSRPGTAARRDALALLIETAASGARAAAYSPYLGADLPGRGSTVFRYQLAPVAQAAHVAAVLRLRRGALVATTLAALLILGNLALLRRRL